MKNVLFRKKIMVLVAILLAFIVFNEDVYAANEICKYSYAPGGKVIEITIFSGNVIKLVDGTCSRGNSKYYDNINLHGLSEALKPNLESGCSDYDPAMVLYYYQGKLGSSWKLKCKNNKKSCPKVYLQEIVNGSSKTLIVTNYKVDGATELTSSMNDYTCTKEDDKSTKKSPCKDDIYEQVENKLFEIADKNKGLFGEEFKSFETLIEEGEDPNKYYAELLKQAEEEMNKYSSDSDGKASKEFQEFIDWFNKNFDCELTPRQTNAIMQRYIKHISNFYDDYVAKINVELDKSEGAGVTTPEQREEIEKQEKEQKERINKKLEIIRQEIATIMDNFVNGKVTEKCTAILSDKLREKLQTYINWIRIIVPILLIMLGSVDMAKAVLIQEKTDDTNKAFNTFIKRCIIAVAIFFLPLVISYLIKQVNKVLPKDIKIDTFEDCELK